jgi:hypothetical protein
MEGITPQKDLNLFYAQNPLLPLDNELSSSLVLDKGEEPHINGFTPFLHVRKLRDLRLIRQDMKTVDNKFWREWMKYLSVKLSKIGFLVLLLTFTLSGIAQAADATVSGQVTVSGTGQAIQGATVTGSYGGSTLTDSNGYYSFTVPLYCWEKTVGGFIPKVVIYCKTTISASKNYYHSSGKELSTSLPMWKQNGWQATANFVLTPNPPTPPPPPPIDIYGYVTDNSPSKNPINGGTVSSPTYGSVPTNQNGYYIIKAKGNKETEYITASASGYNSVSLQVTYDKSKRVDFALPSNAPPPPPPSTCQLTVGHADYCADPLCGPCGAGQADCDNNAECQSGLTCVHDKGDLFGYSKGYDVCADPNKVCLLYPGDPGYCGDALCSPNKCGDGQGECSSSTECQAGLECISNICQIPPPPPPPPPAPPTCEKNLGDPGYCGDLLCGNNNCSEGQGQCSSTGECQSGLECINSICTTPPPPGCQLSLGHPDYCADPECGPCSEGQGICKSTGECVTGLECEGGICQSPVSLIPVPAGRQSWGYQAVEYPVMSNNPSQCMPLGVGPVAYGGGLLSIHVTLGECEGNVDIYAAYALSADPGNIRVLNPDSASFNIYTLAQISDAIASGTPPPGALPWIANTAGPIDVHLFDINASDIPSALYSLYILVTPAG